MTLGETIHQLRTSRGMSQGDLADALEVSRQSVSKWETDASVPDLDKLVRLSRLFDVTLDQLVCGAEAQPKAGGETQESEIPKEKKNPTPVRRIVGAVLLAVGLLGVLIMTFLAGLGGFVFGLLFTLALILCGAFCLKVQRRLGLWCAWGVYLPQQIYWTMGTSITWHLVLSTPWYTASMNYLRLFIGWVMLAVMIVLIVVTARSCSDLHKRPAPGAIVLTAVLWAAGLSTWRIFSLVCSFFVNEEGIIRGGMLLGLFQGFMAAAQTAALAAALTLTLALVRGARAKK